MEKWKTMKEHSNYEISNCGKVRNKKTGRIRKTTINNKGYEQIIVYINKKPKTYYIHRLVASNFIENSNNYKEVNHLDENKLNNNVNNLEWCTYRYNCIYNDAHIKRGIKISNTVRQNGGPWNKGKKMSK